MERCDLKKSQDDSVAAGQWTRGSRGRGVAGGWPVNGEVVRRRGQAGEESWLAEWNNTIDDKTHERKWEDKKENKNKNKKKKIKIK